MQETLPNDVWQATWKEASKREEKVFNVTKYIISR